LRATEASDTAQLTGAPSRGISMSSDGVVLVIG
jgi:hypothetical protein